MTVKIKIVSLSKDEFTIEPISNKSYSYDNSLELRELKQQLQKLELVENEDYSIVNTSSSYIGRIRFQGKSVVVRALWTIPEDMIEFNSYFFSKESYCRDKLNFAIALTKKECFVHDEQFKQKAFDEFYTYIKAEINKIHLPEVKQTAVMQQLDRDILFIDKAVNVNAWSHPKSHLALASLFKAYKDEESAPTLFKEGLLSSLFRRESLLLPKYKAILDIICRIQDCDFSLLCNKLIMDYNLHVASKQKELSLVTSRDSDDKKEMKTYGVK